MTEFRFPNDNDKKNEWEDAPGEVVDMEGKEIEDWAGNGITEIESLLAKHAAFLTFLDDQPTDEAA